MAVAKDLRLVPLDRAELIEISGTDAIAFAHAQFASDVAGLQVGAWQWSAWLNAQGRTRAVFALLRVGADDLRAWLPLGGAATMRDALARFVLRAKVAIAVREGWTLCRLDDGATGFVSEQRLVEHAGGFAFAQPGPQTRTAWLGPARDTSSDASAREAWRLADIAAGLPWLQEATADEFVPQALDLRRLDAVRFDKGCYPGQEIAARLHFRGGNKQSLHRIALTGEGDAGPPGSRIENAKGNVGSILYSARSTSARHEALAVIADAAALPLRSASAHAIEILGRFGN